MHYSAGQVDNRSAFSLSKSEDAVYRFRFIYFHTPATPCTIFQGERDALEYMRK